MDNATRLRYLEAMGITAWRPVASSVPLPPLRAEANNIALPEPTASNSADAAYGEPDREFESPSLFIPAIYNEDASPSSINALDWDELQATVAACTKCGLCKTRTQTVFGSGNTHADWLLIGEAPGQQEDLQGAPFVGPAGQLLTEMLRAIGLGRDEVYIANILKCRPPGNRDPKPEEADNCRPYLERQIALIQPKIILAVGRIAAQTLLGTDSPISKLRGKVHTLNQTPVVVVYHPSYLLRSLLEKKKAWLDLQLALNTYQKTKG
ncbi:uracil-DNA glycosylase [Methylomicrobium sp. Wu6]|uniref:uracil-DNA glycosylase n=1 Tax=Methylomicrobium sp. Wu6 TaxID=3107928 RepID=UPI002DD62F57|nr:uracil-DNA glycosylase [Methylomicrobium sp. Wu6]MEC4747156.1 uracil-DNA glycosylase [Methylomicrobium sp. Wu6]